MSPAYRLNHGRYGFMQKGYHIHMRKLDGNHSQIKPFWGEGLQQGHRSFGQKMHTIVIPKHLGDPGFLWRLFRHNLNMAMHNGLHVPTTTNGSHLGDTDAIVSFDRLEDLTILWRNNQINAIESPLLTLLAQFKLMIDYMPHLKFLHIEDWNGQMPNNLLGTQQHNAVLMRMFPRLTINLSPFGLRSPVKDDPYFLFRHIGESRTST